MTNEQILKGFTGWLRAYKRNRKDFESSKWLKGVNPKSYAERCLACLKHYGKK